MEQTVENCIAHILADTPYEIYDVEYVKEGSEWFLRIYIDKEDGVDLDDCENVTDLINDPLDELDQSKNLIILRFPPPVLNEN